MKKIYTLVLALMMFMSIQAQVLPDLFPLVESEIAVEYDSINKTLSNIDFFIANADADCGSYGFSLLLINEDGDGYEVFYSYSEAGLPANTKTQIKPNIVVDIMSEVEKQSIPEAVYLFGVYVDIDNEVTESDETNNVIILDKTIFIDLTSVSDTTNSDTTATFINENLSTINSLVCYPNPALENTNVSFELSQTDKVAVKVFNTLGEVVYTVVNEELSQGEYNYSLDLGTYTKGLYFVELTTSKGKQTSKFIKR